MGLSSCCTSLRQEKLGWSIVLFSFLADAILLGSRALFGVVIIFWQQEFGWTKAELSSIIALTHIGQAISTPVGGYCADLLPPDLMVGVGLAFLAVVLALVATIQSLASAWIIYGLLCGLSFGVLNLNVFAVAVTKAISKERQGLAVGIASAGSTFGQFTLIPLFAYVHNWRVGYLVLSGVVAVGLIFPSVYLLRTSRLRRKAAIVAERGERGGRLREQGEEERKGDTVVIASTPAICSTRLRKLIFSYPYLALTVAFFICGVTTTGFIETHMISVVVHRGFTLSTGASAFAVLCGVNGISMVIAGWLSDHYSRTLLLGLIFLGRALAYVLLTTTIHNQNGDGGIVWLYTFAVLFGFCDYAVVPPVVSLVTSHAGKEAVGLGVGILLAWHSLGASVGALIGGSLFDVHGNYQLSLMLCAGLCVVAAVASVSICPEPLRRWVDKEEDGSGGGMAVESTMVVVVGGKEKDMKAREAEEVVFF